MRMLTIRDDTDLQSLSGLLLDARISSARAEAALDSLQAVNPHADLRNLRAGTVLFVPEAPGFKTAVSASPASGALGDFQQMVRSALAGAAEKLKAGNAAREDGRAAVAAVIRTAAIKRILDSDAELTKQAAEATKATAEDKDQDAQAERVLAAANKAALDKLAELGKLLS